MGGKSSGLETLFSPATTASRRRPDVQGLRGLAVAMVVGYHAGLPLPGGFVGVDVFFVISGFVITAMLAREWDATGGIDFRRFYLRRFRRLTPALALMVATTLVGSTLILSPVGPQQVAAQTGLGAMLFAANLVIAAATGGYFDQAAELNPLLHTWSLSVEEQFYLVFPLILATGWAAARRRGGSSLIPLTLVAAVGLGSLTLSVIGTAKVALPGLSSSTLGFYSPFTRAWEFAAGSALVLLTIRRRRPTSRGRMSSLAASVGVVLLGCSLWGIDESTPFPGFAATLPVIATGLLIYAGANPENLISRVLSSRPLTRTGDWSYSIYLWHWPFVAFAGVLWPGRPFALELAVAASVVPALASYRWLEQPIRNRSLTSRRGSSTILVTAVAVPVLCAAAVLAASANGYWDRDVKAFLASKTPHAAADCEDGERLFCRWNTEAAGPWVYLVGDSHAGHFGDAAIGAATSLGRPVAISMQYNCPFAIDLEVSLVGEAVSCLEHNERVIESLTRATPGVVLIAGADNYWADANWVVSEKGARTAGGSLEKIVIWETALGRTVDTLQRSGHAVLIVQTVPLHEGYDPARCSTFRIMANGCSHVLAQSHVLQSQGPARAAVSRVASQTNSQAIDAWDYFCPDSRCSTTRGATPLYTNWSHISVSASQALAGHFASMIEAQSVGRPAG